MPTLGPEVCKHYLYWGNLDPYRERVLAHPSFVAAKRGGFIGTLNPKP